MDARIDTSALLGLSPGDAHVLRNAGGRVTDDVIRSLALSQALLGTLEVRVIHHSDCGLHRDGDEAAAAAVERLSGARPPFELLTFADEREAVRADLDLLRGSPFLAPETVVRGFIYDVATGALDEVT